MEKNLYIDASHPNETRVVLKSEENIEDYEYESKKNILVKSNIYLGKVSRVEPSLQATFVDFGRERHGFLAFNDIQPDYYQIPHDDKDRLQKEEENLRLELKEKSKDVEESEKKEQETLNIASTNENNLSNEKNIASKIYKIIINRKQKMIKNKYNLKTLKRKIYKFGVKRIDYIKII